MNRLAKASSKHYIRVSSGNVLFTLEMCKGDHCNRHAKAK